MVVVEPPHRGDRDKSLDTGLGLELRFQEVEVESSCCTVLADVVSGLLQDKGPSEVPRPRAKELQSTQGQESRLPDTFGQSLGRVRSVDELNSSTSQKDGDGNRD